MHALFLSLKETGIRYSCDEYLLPLHKFRQEKITTLAHWLLSWSLHFYYGAFSRLFDTCIITV